MERLLYDTKSSDVAVAWRAAHCAGAGALAKQLTRKRLEVRLEKKLLVFNVNEQNK